MLLRQASILIRVGMILLTASIAVIAQDPPGTEQQQKAQAALKEKALQLLDQVIAEAQALKLPENRLRLQWQAGDLLWERDEARARTLFSQASAGIGEMIQSLDRNDRRYNELLQAPLQLTRRSSLPTGGVMLRQSVLVACALLLTMGAIPASGQVPPSSTAKLGAPAPELGFEKLLQAPEGTKTDWASLRGKVIVLEFWATWCAPCIAAMPHLNGLAEKFKDQPVQFIAITDESEPFVAPFLQRRVIKGWVGLDEDRSIFDAYGVQGIPRTIVVDRDGKIAALTTATSLTEARLGGILEGKSPSVAPEKSIASATAPRNPPATPTTPTLPTREDAPARFEITIKPAKSEGNSMSQTRGRFRASGDLKTALGLIHNFPNIRIFGPPLLVEARYDISATMLEGNTDDLKAILAKTIEASFKLRVRREMREMEVFVLTAPDQAAINLKPNPAVVGHASHADGVIAAAAVPIQTLVEQLEGVLKQPVTDETKLPGKYNWNVLFDAKRPDSIIDAIRQDLGLELKRARRRIEVMVVDKIE